MAGAIGPRGRSALAVGQECSSGDVLMGTLRGFPCHPAMGLVGQSPPGPHAISTAALRASMMDSVVAWHPRLADESRSGSSRPLGVTPGRPPDAPRFRRVPVHPCSTCAHGEAAAARFCSIARPSTHGGARFELTAAVCGRRFLNRSELGASAGGRGRLRGGVSERTERLRSVASERPRGRGDQRSWAPRDPSAERAMDARSAAVGVRPPRSATGISPPAPSGRFLRCPFPTPRLSGTPLARMASSAYTERRGRKRRRGWTALTRTFLLGLRVLRPPVQGPWYCCSKDELR